MEPGCEVCFRAVFKATHPARGLKFADSTLHSFSNEALPRYWNGFSASLREELVDAPAYYFIPWQPKNVYCRFIHIYEAAIVVRYQNRVERCRRRLAQNLAGDRVSGIAARPAEIQALMLSDMLL